MAWTAGVKRWKASHAICVCSGGIWVGDGDIWLETQRGTAWVGREKREQKEMAAPGDEVSRAEGSVGQGREGVRHSLK